jgi:twitching motility two-component system response regulator PilH
VTVKKILVVDDEPDTVAYLTAILEDNEYSVCSAHNAEKALELLDKELPDLMLVDVMMPGASGLNLIRQVRSHPGIGDLPVIVVSGKAEVLRDGFQSYLDRLSVKHPDGIAEKPFDPAALLKMVGELLQG